MDKEGGALTVWVAGLFVPVVLAQASYLAQEGDALVSIIAVFLTGLVVVFLGLATFFLRASLAEIVDEAAKRVRRDKESLLALPQGTHPASLRPVPRLDLRGELAVLWIRAVEFSAARGAAWLPLGVSIGLISEAVLLLYSRHHDGGLDPVVVRATREAAVGYAFLLVAGPAAVALSPPRDADGGRTRTDAYSSSSHQHPPP